MKNFGVVAETRGRWLVEERRQIVAETEGSPVSVVARRHGVAASLVFRWRRQAGMKSKRNAIKPALASFVPVALPGPSPIAETAQKVLRGAHGTGASLRSSWLVATSCG